MKVLGFVLPTIVFALIMPNKNMQTGLSFDQGEVQDAKYSDFFLAILADPQLGTQHAWDAEPLEAASMEEELKVFQAITSKLATFKNDLEFVMVNGDMQQYFPTGSNNPVLSPEKLGYDVAAKQREATKEALEPLGKLVKYLPGNHDLDQKVTGPVLTEYINHWGADFYKFEKHNVNFLVLNSQLYWETPSGAEDRLVAEHKKQQNANFSEWLKSSNNVVLTHLPPFIQNQTEPGSRGNWHDRSLFAWSKSANFPKQWFAGHWHKNWVNTVDGIEIVVTSSCASTMDLGGPAEFQSAKDAFVSTETFDAKSQIFDKGGTIRPGPDRSGLRIVKSNAGNKPLCTHKWLTLAEFEKLRALTDLKL